MSSSRTARLGALLALLFALGAPPAWAAQSGGSDGRSGSDGKNGTGYSCSYSGHSSARNPCLPTTTTPPPPPPGAVRTAPPPPLSRRAGTSSGTSSGDSSTATGGAATTVSTLAPTADVSTDPLHAPEALTSATESQHKQSSNLPLQVAGVVTAVAALAFGARAFRSGRHFE